MQKVPTLSLKSRFQKQEVQIDWTIDDWKVLSGAQGMCESMLFTLPNSNIACNMMLNLNENQIYVIISHNQTAFLHPELQIFIVLPTNKLYDLGNEVMPTLNVNSAPSSAPCRFITRCFNLPKYELTQFVHPNGSFNFKCNVKYTTNRDSTHCGQPINCAWGTGSTKPHEAKFILKDYGALYEKQLMCDVILVTAEGKKLKAHSVILAMVSPYFLAMFTKEDSKESTPRIVDLTNDTNISFEVCQGFLDYVYGVKSVSDLKNIVMELFILANKYGIPILNYACESFLCDNLTHTNVAKLLLFSHKNDCILLKQKAVAVAKSNMQVIKSSSEFDKIFEDKDLMLLLL